MTEHNNPGPPERCYDDCPMNHTGNSEDCTCAGTTVDSDAALFARQRDDARAIVLAVSRILGISHLADGLEHGRVTSAVRSWMDAAEQLTRERDAAGAEVGRLREELADVRASREAWAIEADRLDAELKERPTAWAYEQADRALEKRRVALVEALGARPGAGFYDSVDDVAELVRDRAALSGMLRGMARRASAMRRALRARPAIPADAVVLPDNWETQIRQALHARAHDISEAGPLPGTSSHDRDAERCADEIAGDVVVLINDWMSAPVSGSDTTADGAGR